MSEFEGLLMWSVAYLYELRTPCMEFSRKRTEDEHSVIFDLTHQKQKWYFKFLMKINQPKLVFKETVCEGVET